MNMDRPAINILYNDDSKDALKEILAGIEEESVLFEAQLRDTLSSDNMAIEAAAHSRLGVGIGLSRESASMTDSRLEQTILMKVDSISSIKLRELGKNAARIVKGTPLKDSFL